MRRWLPAGKRCSFSLPQDGLSFERFQTTLWSISDRQRAIDGKKRAPNRSAWRRRFLLLGHMHKKHYSQTKSTGKRVIWSKLGWMDCKIGNLNVYLVIQTLSTFERAFSQTNINKLKTKSTHFYGKNMYLQILIYNIQKHSTKITYTINAEDSP